MTSLRIAEVAARAGVPATTLRYYEQIGLIAASRSDNGYRSYSERDLERLAFISRAKQLDISLEQLRDLVEAWDSEDCATVAHSMAEAVSVRLAETQTRIGELVALAAQLQGAQQRLAGTPSGGPGRPCGADCPCVAADSTAPAVAGPAVAVPAQLTGLRLAGLTASAPIACSLSGGDFAERVADWQQVLAGARTREQAPGKITLTFANDPGLAGELARLAAAEHACCPFLTFALHVDAGTLTLHVLAPAEAAELHVDVFGATERDLSPAGLAQTSGRPELGLQAAASCDCC